MVRTAILVSTPIREGLSAAIASGEAPRRDYFELRDRLGATLMAPPEHPSRAYRLLRKAGGNALAMAFSAWARRREYDVILTDQESAGLLLAALFKLTHTRRAHVMISHYLTPAKKQVFFKLGAQSHIDRTICYSTAQERVAHDKLGLGSGQVSLVLHPADSTFWRPAASDAEAAADEQLLRDARLDLDAGERTVCSAGLEFRDYATLVKAAANLPPNSKVIIAASSPWSKRANTAREAQVPANVQVVSLKPLQLRALYRRADVVAIPLFDVDFQAGSLVAYEAMACGRPVVITRTRGQADIVLENETGLYVPPDDAAALAGALTSLLADRDRAREMGRRARETVERGLNLDTYLGRMCELVLEVAGRHGGPGPVFGRAASEPR